LEVLNFALLNNKPIRVMYSNRDPSSRRSGSANIFIKVLDHLAVSLVCIVIQKQLAWFMTYLVFSPES